MKKELYFLLIYIHAHYAMGQTPSDNSTTSSPIPTNTTHSSSNITSTTPIPPPVVTSASSTTTTTASSSTTTSDPDNSLKDHDYKFPDLHLDVTGEDELHMDGDESEITRCTSQVSNTFFNQGLRLAVASMKNRLPDGIPEYGIPPMEPLELEPMSVEIARFPVQLNVSIKDMKVWDLTTFTRNNWFLDINTRILDMNLIVPSFLVTGEFTLLPNQVKGNISIKFDGVTIRSKTKMKIIDTSRNPRQTPIKADRSVSDMKYEKVRIRMTDLFPHEKGYDELNYAFRVFTEKYSELLYEEVRPFVNAGTEKIILGITDAVLNSPVFQRALPANGILPGLNLSTLTNWYDRVRNALSVQLPSVLTRSNSYRSLISLLEAAFKSCRSYTDVTDHLTQPFINLLGLITH